MLICQISRVQTPPLAGIFIEGGLIGDGGRRHDIDLMVWPGVAVNSHLPATNVLVGLDNEEIPIGIQVIGPYLEDRTTINFGQLCLSVFDGFFCPL